MNTNLNPGAHAPMTLRCPKCAAEMVTYERSGIVVDQCRECRGIFLDRGELEKLVDAESGAGWTGPQMPALVAADPRLPGDPRLMGGDPRVIAADPRVIAADPRAVAGDPRYADRSDWRRDDDDDDDDDRRYPRDRDWDDRDRWDGRGRPPKRRSLLGELLEGLGD